LPCDQKPGTGPEPDDGMWLMRGGRGDEAFGAEAAGGNLVAQPQGPWRCFPGQGVTSLFRIAGFQNRMTGG
jgi:hypothetical protein